MLARNIMLQAFFELTQDRLRIVSAHGEDERKAELPVVRGVQLMQAREFRLRAGMQARSFLFAPRLGCQLVAHRRAPGKFRVRTDQSELLSFARCRDDRAHRIEQLQA